MRTFVVEVPDIKQIRADYKLSQTDLPHYWELVLKRCRTGKQGRRIPEGAARVSLEVGERHREAVWDVVKAKPTAA